MLTLTRHHTTDVQGIQTRWRHVHRCVIYVQGVLAVQAAFLPLEITGDTIEGQMSSLKAAAPADKDGDKGRVSFAKVQRYWAGKRIDADVAVNKEEPTSSFFAARDVGVQRTPVAPAVVVKKADPRLARLSRTDVAEARDETRQRHRYELMLNNLFLSVLVCWGARIAW